MCFYFSSSCPVSVGAPVNTAHDFNHGLAASIQEPPFQGMPEPSLYGLQTQSTIAGDPHCFSGSTSSTVPLLLGTPGYLSSHGMMGQPMHELQTQSTIPRRRNTIQWLWHNHSHPPARNPRICFPAWNAKFFTSQHAE